MVSIEFAYACGRTVQ